MRVTPDRLDVAEAALEAYAEHLMQYGRAVLSSWNDLCRVIEALPERSDAMSDPIKDYARAVAEAVYDVLANSLTPQVVDLDAIIATVPAPVMQHHAAPTCDGWWWAGDGVGWRTVYVTLKTDKWHSCYDRWVGPLLPPDTTEPAPVATPKWCNVHQHHKWCEHNGGVMGPTGYAAPDEQAQVVTFRTVELDDVAHHALRQAAQDVLDEAPTIQTPDVQTQDDHLIERLRNRVRVSNYEHLAEVAKVDVEEACRRLADVQAQIDAAYRRGVEDGLKRAKP